MKIRFRIGAGKRNHQGNEQRGEQSLRQQNWPVTPPSPWSLGSPVSGGTAPTENPADHSLRRGTACCARCDASDRRYSLADRSSMRAAASWLRIQPQASGQPTAPRTKKPFKTVQFPSISNRFWLKNRSYRNQRTKPRLTGARTAFSDSGLLRDFCANFAPPELHQEHPAVAWKTLES
jgi:hypothetical protein